MGVGDNATIQLLYIRELHCTCCAGGTVRPRGGPTEYDPQTVQPVADRYINYTIQAHYMVHQVLKQKFLPTASKYVPIFSETSFSITPNYWGIFYFQNTCKM